jgi:hypothetical protein
VIGPYRTVVSRAKLRRGYPEPASGLVAAKTINQCQLCGKALIVAVRITLRKPLGSDRQISRGQITTGFGPHFGFQQALDEADELRRTERLHQEVSYTKVLDILE